MTEFPAAVTSSSTEVVGPSTFRRNARRDLLTGLSKSNLWGVLGWLDIRQRYRRSRLGPFWLTISMGLTVLTLGFLYSFLFKVPTEELLPWLTVGFVMWSFINNTIIESCVAFVQAEGYIKQLQMPLSVHAFRVVWRNIISMSHNLIILPFVYLFYGRHLSAEILLVIPGFLLLVANLIWIGLFLAIICTRFRDLPQMVQSVIQIAFYLTPIIWTPVLLPPEWRPLLDFNPFYHLIELVRAPLLGTVPATYSILVTLGAALFGGLLTTALYTRTHRRIAYWL